MIRGHDHDNIIDFDGMLLTITSYLQTYAYKKERKKEIKKGFSYAQFRLDENPDKIKEENMIFIELNEACS